MVDVAPHGAPGRGGPTAPEGRPAGPLGARRTDLRLVRRLAWASLVSQVALVVTGGAVRLTSSGLGCPTWPRCTSRSLVPTPAYGIHGVIEFGNRLLTYVLVTVAVATLAAALAYRPKRRDLRRLSAALLLGVPVQGVIGGISVLTDLNPWVVGLHFLASSVLVGLAALLVRRAGDAGGPGRRVVPAALEHLARLQLVVLGAVLVVGTVVTGSGPHAGDRHSPRNGLRPQAVSQLHADLVFLLVGMTLAALLALAALAAPAAARRATLVLLAAELAQGLVGFVQYVTGVPVVLVAVHMLGAALLVVAATTALDALRDRPPAPALSPLSR